MDPRLSNTASMADYWMPSYPGTEAAVLLAMAKVILGRKSLRRRVREELDELGRTGSRRILAPRARAFEALIEALEEALRAVHAAVCRERKWSQGRGHRQDSARDRDRRQPICLASVARERVRQTGRMAAGARVDAAACADRIGRNRRRTQSECLEQVCPARPFKIPPPQKRWNELLYPQEWPLCTHEMSFLLPHFLKEGRGRIEAYFTRVFNPVWTYPDGFSWIEMLRDEEKVGLHAALTPTWSETAWFADYVLPMGFSSERHDLMSQESYAGKWIGFRQPVLRVLRERAGEKFDYTYQANPGEVWEEDEFWINLSWAIDPDGSMGIRQWFESPYRPGQKLTVDEYYGWIFENSVPGPARDRRRKKDLSRCEYMRKYGAYEVTTRCLQAEREAGSRRRSFGIKRRSERRGQEGWQAGRRDGRGQSGRRLQHAFAQAGTIFENHGRLEVAGVRAARVLPQPHPSLGAGGFAWESRRRRFRSAVHAPASNGQKTRTARSTRCCRFFVCRI